MKLKLKGPWLLLTGLAIATATAMAIFISMPVYIGMYDNLENDLPTHTRLLLDQYLYLCLFPLLVPVVWLAWQRRKHPGLAAVVTAVITSALILAFVYWAAIQPDLIEAGNQTEYGQ